MKVLISKDEIDLLTSINFTLQANPDDQEKAKKRLQKELQEMEDNRDFFLMFRGEMPVAMVQLIYKNADNDPRLADGKSIAHIHDLEVRKDCQRQGIATEIMSQLEREAINRGITTLTLGVDDFNGVAIKLYEKLGYVQFATEEGRTPEEKVLLMKKSIT